MTLDNLITLITAGFTKDEILTMSGTATQRAPQPHPQPQPQPQHQPQPQPQFYPQNYQQSQTPVQGVQGYAQQFPQMFPQAQAQAQPQAYPQTQQIQQISEQNDVLNALKSLTSAVQSNNVNLMQNTVPKQVTTEDAIASIINPPDYDGLTGGEK